MASITHRVYQSIFHSFITYNQQIQVPACQISIQFLGAAVAVAVASDPGWEQGYVSDGNVGGLPDLKK